MKKSIFREIKSILKRPTAVFGIVIILVVIFIAVAAPLLTPFRIEDQNISKALLPPAWQKGGESQFPLGTDALGRDLFARIIYGARISLLVGVLAVVVQGVLGILLGLIAGYYGGIIDRILMGFVDLQMSIPFLIMALALIAVLGPGLNNIIIVLGITGWVVYGRVIRSEVLVLKEQDFIQASRAIGTSNLRIILTHILPNCSASAIVISTLEVGKMITAEAALSFLGLGIQPPIPSWGRMIADGRTYISTHWWIAFFPGLAMFITILAINMFGDWLRDRFDPTLYT